MSGPAELNAIVYCQGALGSTNGKTAHGLIRRSRRYRIVGVIDSGHSGKDAGSALGGLTVGIPVLADLHEAMLAAYRAGHAATHFIIGVAPDGGRLTERMRLDVCEALRAGLHVVSGLHDFLGDDDELSSLAQDNGVTLRDVRKPPARSSLHFFCGKIEEVTALRVAVLGTDSAVGKRTTAWQLVDAFTARGRNVQLVGTGQTAWLQGAHYSLCLDSLVNDFVSGEIEHAVWSAWSDGADTIVVEGQGSLLNPAYPGGFEILAAARPHAVVLQHAPARREYDGFPGYALHPLERQIQAIELISDCPVVAIALNHENMDQRQLSAARESIQEETGLSVCDPLGNDLSALVAAIESRRPEPTGVHRVSRSILANGTSS